MHLTEIQKKQIKLVKKSQKLKNADLLGAFPCDDVLTLELTLPRSFGAHGVYLLLWDDDRQENTRHNFSWGGTDFVTESFVLSLELSSICKNKTDGLFWYSIVLGSSVGTLRICEQKGSYIPCVKPVSEYFDGFQLTVYEKSMKTPDWMKGNIMYHVFVDRFCKQEPIYVRPDAVLEEDWDNYSPEYAKIAGGFVRNNRFYGGNLYGVAKQLEYIKLLGVSVLYLSPIFEAASNQKYDTGNYEKVDEMFGGDEALDILLEKAKELGIRVVLDGVFNHTGSDSVYFNKEGRYGTQGAYNDINSPYYEWFDFENYPDKLAAFAAASRFIQGESLKTIYAAVRYFDKARSGMIVWMGSEPFPNAQNTCLLEFDGYAKPSYYETRKGYAQQTVGLKYDRPYANEKGEIEFLPFLCSDTEFDFGTVTFSVYNEKGEETDAFSFENVKDSGTIKLVPINVTLDGEVCIVRAVSSNIDGVLGEWVFTANATETFAPLLKTKKCKLETVKLDASTFVITNKSEQIAYFNEIGAFDKNGTPLLTDKNFFCLLPNEVVKITVDGKTSKLNITQMNQY